MIDERLDLSLIAAVADARPDWHLVMAGPVEGLSPEQLPQRPNLHWIGRQPYERLPHLLAQWDVALLPYAVNARTRGLNPTQALEYMAAEKPVVSTALPDVRALHADTVSIAADRMDFIAACDELLGENAAARQRRITDMTYAASSMSWERTAQAVGVLLSKALALHPARPASTMRRPIPIEMGRPLPGREPVPAANEPLEVDATSLAAAPPGGNARHARGLRPVRVSVPATQFAIH